MARPKIKIDEEQVRKLAQKQWDCPRIAEIMGVSADTIRRRYAAKIVEWKASGKAKLIDALFNRALVDKSDKMLKEALDRFIGPIAQHVKVESATITKTIERIDGSGEKHTNTVKPGDDNG